MAAQREHPLISTIFVRTLMDRRYFHGIRAAAVNALVKHAKEEIDWLGLFHLERAFQELFCLPNSPMTRSNDFSDRAAYVLQMMIPEAISKVRDNNGKTPMRVKRFLHDKLKFNDNSNNEVSIHVMVLLWYSRCSFVLQYSDNFYVAMLMRSLCHAMLGKVESAPVEMDDFDMERMLELQAEEQLEKDALAEIDRYRRMDEWSSSFQNVYSRAALSCQRQLMQANIVEMDIMQFLPYTRAGTYDLLRLDAFECLVEMDVFKSPELLKWFIFTMSNDSSAWFRRQLHNLFGNALAPVAFGREADTQAPTSGDGLIIEQESSTEVRQANLARKQTITGAMEALKLEVSGDQVLKEALWAACNSPCIGILELSEFVDLCRIIYNPVTSVRISLKYPRYWKVKHLGKVCKTTHVMNTRYKPAHPAPGPNAFFPIQSFPHHPCLIKGFICGSHKAQTRRTRHAPPWTSYHIQAVEGRLKGFVPNPNPNTANDSQNPHSKSFISCAPSVTSGSIYAIHPIYSRWWTQVKAKVRPKAEISSY